MPRQRSMAGLARNDNMLALLFLINNIGVAGFANIVTRECSRPGRDLRDGIAPVVAVLSKTARNDSSTQHNKRHQGDCHDCGQPDEVFRVFEQVRIPASNVGRVLRGKIAQCSWILCISFSNDDPGHRSL